MKNIKNAISKFSNNGSLIEGTKELFKALNIPFQVISSADYKPSDFFEKTDKFNDKIIQINTVILIDDKAFNNQYATIASNTLRTTDKYDALGVFTVDLSELEPSRSTLVEITRALNREMEAFPVAVVFRYGNTIAIASAERTDYKSSSKSGEKIGKVSLIRDIDTINIHPGHLQILNELSIERTGKNAITSFDGLYKYWFSVFNVSLLNKKFYKELSNWYFWALREVKFPNEPNRFDFESDDKYDEAINEHNGKNVIRLLTRILFVWFIKEKGLIPEELFDEKIIAERFIDGFTPEKPESLFSTGKHSSKYYRGIIQNLFFATLNQPHGKREFRNSENRQHHNVTQLMRYKEYLKEPEYFIKLMEDKVPFMNGGLFECLDKPHPTQKGKQGGEIIIYIDGFSDRDDNVVTVPDFLFFDKEEELDLSKDYGDKTRKKEKTRGLITILKNYKFTITENTPIEEEVALDPELLGKVFENLLASYNPETKSSARKQTGSFYTPREIVNYMVEESLIAYLKNKLGDDTIEEDLRDLVSFSSSNPFENDPKTKHDIIKALDQCTILDPASGSGAYPMGILQKMVHILHKIDPNNEEWKQRQLEKVNKALDDIYEIEDNSIRDKISKELKEQIKDIEESFNNNELDFGRKLYLIENCIYGVDIQPIATQISKLRFFISLVVDQKVDATKENFGIRPLPNLETKFVAANTLIGLDKSSNLFDLPDIKAIEKQLKKVRHELFSAKNKKTKNEKRELDKVLRNQIAFKLEGNGFGTDIAKKLAAWDPYDQNTSSDFFDKEWMFDRTEGFDIVIGNPPYVQLQKLNGSEMYSKLGFFTYSKSSDLYCLFYEKGIQLLNNGGNLNYITSNSWMRTKYGQALRTFFANKTNPIQLINFEDVQIFDSAVVESNIFITEKKPFEKVFQAVNLGSDFITGMDFKDYLIKKGVVLNELDNNGWILGDFNVLDLKKKIENNSTVLGNLNYRINIGVNTGLNEVFIINQETKNKLITIDNNNSKILKPILRGRDLKRYQYSFSEYYLINSHNGIKSKKIKPINVINDYPSLYEYFSSNEIKLKNRYDQGEHWTNLRNCAYIEDFLKPKIIWGELSDKAKFTYDENSYFLDATVFLMTGENLKYILSIFNSTLAQWYFEQIATSSGMGTNRWKKYKIEQFPIKVISESRMESFETKVDIILNSKKENISSESVEREIDVMVFKLYDLTYEEVLVIEPNFSRSKEDYELFMLE